MILGSYSLVAFVKRSWNPSVGVLLLGRLQIIKKNVIHHIKPESAPSPIESARLILIYFTQQIP